MGRQRLGLDELMIVNPGRGATDAVLLGEDGTLYRLRRVRDVRWLTAGHRRPSRRCGCRGHDLLLGDDGRLYQVHY
jgi:hypothetical protein